MLKTAPAVFAVGNTYQIMVEVAAESLMSVMVGDTVYYDESNGIMNSRASIHRVTVPMAALDAAGAYTVCLRPLVERKPYYTETRQACNLRDHCKINNRRELNPWFWHILLVNKPWSIPCSPYTYPNA